MQQQLNVTVNEWFDCDDETAYRDMLSRELKKNWAGGFCQMPDVVRQDRTLSPKAKIVYEQLLSYMWFQSDHCWPSQQTLADATSYSRRTVIRACKELCERGYIEKWRRGQGYTNYYFINPLSFPHSFRRTTRERAESMILDVHAPELRQDITTSAPCSLDMSLYGCHFGTSARDTVSHPEVTTCHRNQTKENQSHGKEMDSNLSSPSPKGRGFPVAVQTTRNEHEEHVQTKQQQGESALQTWRNKHYANKPTPYETERHDSENQNRKTNEPIAPSKKPNSSARSSSQANVPAHAKDAKYDTRWEQQTKQAAISALTGIPQGHLSKLEIAQAPTKRPIPEFLKDIISRYSRELGDSSRSTKSNITRAAKLYFFTLDYIKDAQDDPQGFFAELLYEAKQAAYKVINIRYHNSSGRPNRIPVFFTCLENRFELSDAEREYIRSDELLYEPSW